MTPQPGEKNVKFTMYLPKEVKKRIARESLEADVRLSAYVTSVLKDHWNRQDSTCRPASESHSRASA